MKQNGLSDFLGKYDDTPDGSVFQTCIKCSVTREEQKIISAERQGSNDESWSCIQMIGVGRKKLLNILVLAYFSIFLSGVGQIYDCGTTEANVCIKACESHLDMTTDLQRVVVNHGYNQLQTSSNRSCEAKVCGLSGTIYCLSQSSFDHSLCSNPKHIFTIEDYFYDMSGSSFLSQLNDLKFLVNFWGNPDDLTASIPRPIPNIWERNFK